jgi:hypothetical protein
LTEAELAEMRRLLDKLGLREEDVLDATWSRRPSSLRSP